MEMSNEWLRGALPLCYSVDRHFNHIGNQSEEKLAMNVSAQLSSSHLHIPPQSSRTGVARCPTLSFYVQLGDGVIWLLPLSELSSWRSFCICQVMPLEMSLWAKQHLAVCILITHMHKVQTGEEDCAFIINTIKLTPPQNSSVILHHTAKLWMSSFRMQCLENDDLIPRSLLPWNIWQTLRSCSCG